MGQISAATSPQTGSALGGIQQLDLFLYHDDMRRLGSELADLFCQSLSGGDRYFEEEAGTARLQEAAAAA